MTVKLAAAAALLGGLLLSVGLTLGLSGISRDGQSCGSAFKPASPAELAGRDLGNAISNLSLGTQFNASASTDCASATSDRKPVALAFTIPGAILLVIGAGFAIAAVNARDAARLDQLARERQGGATDAPAEDVQPTALP